MKRKLTITAKRLADRRFQKTEDAILKAFFDDPHITASQLARRTGVARSTIYNHHHSISEIIPNYENYIFMRYSRFINKTLAKDKKPNIRTLYVQTFSFILQHKKIFTIFIKTENFKIFEKIVKKLRPSSIDGFEKVLDIYTSEVAKILFRWGQKGFNKMHFENVLHDTLYLTETARERLVPMLRLS